MKNSELIIAVIRQFRELFLDKAELKGYDDWDRFFGCISQLENLAVALAEAEKAEETSEE